jgi:hypothetical protein
MKYIFAGVKAKMFPFIIANIVKRRMTGERTPDSRGRTFTRIPAIGTFYGYDT